MDTPVTRYAAALLSLAEDENRITAYKSAVKKAATAFQQTPDFLVFLGSAFISESEKRAALDRIFGDPEVPSLAPFLKVVVDHDRARDLPEILQAVIRMANERLGIEEGTVYSTLPLTAEKIQAIEAVLGRQNQSRVELVNALDPALIGGIKVVIKDRVYDGTVANMLSALQSQLLKGK